MEPGTQVFDDDGRAWEFLTELGDEGTAVLPVYEDGRTGRPVILRRELYEVAPVQVLDESCRIAREKLESLHDQINIATGELYRLERELPQRIEELSQMDGAVTRIEDFLQGRITHFVSVQYGKPKILTFEEATTPERNEWPHKARKLVALFGKSDGSLAWKVNEYKDGSGSWKESIPCISIEQAELTVALVVGDLLGSENQVDRIRGVRAADEFGLSVPPKIREEVRAHDRARLAGQVEDRERELRKIEEKLTAFDLSTDLRGAM
jgi:hypothetical protein